MFAREDQTHKRNIPEQHILPITPDGATMFVSIFDPGVTVGITGPWRERAPVLA